MRVIVSVSVRWVDAIVSISIVVVIIIGVAAAVSYGVIANPLTRIRNLLPPNNLTGEGFTESTSLL